MLDAIRHANPYILLGIAFAIGFVWMLVRAQVWRTLLRNRASYQCMSSGPWGKVIC